MVELKLTGNTYGIKNVIKGLEFRWNPNEKAWIRRFENRSDAEEIARRWVREGVYGIIKEV